MTNLPDISPADLPAPHKPTYRLHLSAADSVTALKRALREAEHSIDFETFYILPDSVGREILDILLEKAQSGVKVKLLCDAMGSFSVSTSMYVKDLHKAGSAVKFFNTILPFTKTAKTIWYLRNHRRTIIIDGRILFVGSLCIGEPAKDWTEAMIELTNSDAVGQAHEVFNKTWKKSSRRTFKIGNASVMSADAFSYITQSPLQNQRHLYDLLLKKIRDSKQSIMFAVPYLIPDHRLFRTLRKAAKRGVKITFICPKKTDFYLADLSRDSYIHALLRNRIEVYFLPFMVHSKVTVFDDRAAMIGTLNLDNISLRYNYECAIYTDDTDCVRDLREHLTSLTHHYPASRLTPHLWEKRGFIREVLEFLVLPFRKLF
jgi:cardiolipin synthase